MKKFLLISCLTLISCVQEYQVSSLDVILSDNKQHFNDVIVKIEPTNPNSLKISITPNKISNLTNSSKKFLFKTNGVYYKSGEDLLYLGRNYASVISRLYELKSQNIIDDNVIDEFNKINKEIEDKKQSLRGYNTVLGTVSRNMF